MSTLRIAGLGFLAAFLSSCAGGAFDRDWNAAVAAYEAEGAPAEAPFLGPWTGTWLSDMNAHTGGLRCLVSPVDSGSETTYEFRYHATWGDFFSGGYRADYEVTPDGKGGFEVKGSKDLGMFGSFDHEGLIQGDAFDSTYASDKGDHGAFKLKRPAKD